MDRTDAELIDEHLSGSPTALDALVRRHLDLVYSIALRRTADPTLADDVTQAVFIVLTKKARSLRSYKMVAGWLVVVTNHVAKTAIRSRTRRQRHERSAAKPEGAVTPDTSQEVSAEIPTELSAAVDDALSRLRPADRDAIVLRYLQSQSLSDVGKSLGVSEEAARKRVDRGIEKLRGVLERRGIGLAAVALASGLTTFAARPAPAATVTRVTTTGTPVSETVEFLSKGAMRMLMLAMNQMTVVSLVVAVCLAAGVMVWAQAAQDAVAPPAAPPLGTPAAAPGVAYRVNSLALTLLVTDVEANMDFLRKIGFEQRWADQPNARGRLPRASMANGVVAIRLARTYQPVKPVDSMTAKFWVEGGNTALEALRTKIVAQGVTATPVADDIQLREFTVTTPDGYTLGYYSAR